MVLLSSYSLVGCQAQLNRTKIEKTLIKELFKDYDPEGRPVLNLSQPVLVKFGLAYSNLHSLVSNLPPSDASDFMGPCCLKLILVSGNRKCRTIIAVNFPI